MSKEAMKLALARLQARTDTADLNAIAALNEALAEQPAQQQEPVDALDNPRPVGEITWGGCVSWNGSIPDYGTDLYTAPPARKPLTDERLWKIWNSQGDDAMEQQAAINFARAVEAAHGIKDTP